MMSSSSEDLLNIIQGVILGIALVLLRPTSTVLIYELPIKTSTVFIYAAEAGECPIKTEIKRTYIHYIIRAVTRPHPTPIIRLEYFHRSLEPSRQRQFKNDSNIPIFQTTLVRAKLM